ncbi:adenylate/guanylate cyclase domain-containing protein [Ramlibacter albus]|uniref:Adenylate/guanylate cyclase domain-containing protein n=1 Tax=Ramlibacter albus TaxID=2079448 RepID=A0A923M7X9_9BURK|nr:adenylate/guanylate cyclase domain-containing protein [Ramlibacter albus]MBC5765912.1 adenylate/guanylate cyclase domain-containing protein [Ramlibacter albus]
MTAALVALGLLAAALGVLLVRATRNRRRLELLLADRAARLERLETEFSRFAPSLVVEHVTGMPEQLAPSRREVTVMFADVREFTRLCETTDAAQTVAILNGYFERMTQAIVDHHGHVTQFIGDGLLALFGALEPNPWQARDAVDAALAMRDALARYNAELAAKAWPQLGFGVGIHRGEVVVGLMGNRNLATFTVVGDTVNTAARVEALTRTHGTDVLVTQAVRDALGERYLLHEQPAAPVKGKERPVVTFAVSHAVPR